MCVEGVGCTCDLGGCDDNPSDCEETVLDPCQFWTCADNCCEIDSVAAPNCCTSNADCRACLDLDTLEHYPCPDGAADGAIVDLCMKITCENSECSSITLIGESPWDDGDECTQDSCDPATGEHLHLPIGGCGSKPCWGATGEEAQDLCADNNLCTLDSCDYGDQFAPWEGADGPEFDPVCSEMHPDWPDCDPKPGNVYYCKNDVKTCDDYDKCTIDACDDATGCIHEIDYEWVDCWCDDDADCADDEDCTVEKCNLELQVCVYPQFDCDDCNLCTIDSCVPGEGCHHEETELCNICDSGQLCLPQYDPAACCDGDPCTNDFCEFKPGDEFGCCKHFEPLCDLGACCQDGGFCDSDNNGKCVCLPVEIDDDNECTFDSCNDDLGVIHETYDSSPCDDGDPETENTCVGGVCVVV